MKIDMWLYVFTLFIVCRNYQTQCRTSRNSEAPLPGPVQHVDIPKGLTDLELFEKFCLPSIFDDAWNDVSWLGPITLPEPHKYVIYIYINQYSNPFILYPFEFVHFLGGPNGQLILKPSFKRNLLIYISMIDRYRYIYTHKITMMLISHPP